MTIFCNALIYGHAKNYEHCIQSIHYEINQQYFEKESNKNCSCFRLYTF